MRGKLFLLAVVCVSFVQVRGDPELEQAIRNGLGRLAEIVQAGAGDIASFKNFASKLTADSSKRFREIVTSANGGLVEAEKAVRNVANSTMEKVDDSRLPESVEKCVEKCESYALENMKGLFDELRKQGSNQLNLTLDNVQSFVEAITRKESNLRDEIKVTDNKIRGSEDAKAVDNVVNAFESQVNKLLENVDWITWQLQDISNDYEKQVNSYYSEFKLDLAKIKSSASRDMRLCVLDTSAIIQLFQNLIE